MEEKTKIDSIEARIAGLEAAIGRIILRMDSSPIALAYPEPLATPLARESSATLYHERFFSLLDAGEAFIKYSGAIAIGLFNMGGQNFDVNKEFAQPVSLGRWVEIINEVLSSGKLPDNSIANSFKTSLVKPNGKLTSAGRFFLEEFTNIRNIERGHASSLPDGAYERLHLRHAQVVHDALGNCAYLYFPLIRIESSDVATDPISYDIRHLVGPPPLTRVERIQSGNKLHLNNLYIWDNDDIFVNLSELVIYITCPTCNLTHTFFLEKLTGKSLFYHSYFGNHRFKL